LSNQLAILDNYIAQIDLDIQATSEKIETTKLEIDEIGLTIEDKENTIKETMKKRPDMYLKYKRLCHPRACLPVGRNVGILNKFGFL
jgi:chromosome segregation ATPase